MKHSRFTKLFVLILSLALLIGSAVCVAASADEGADYGIKSVNIAHGDKIQVLIAVDAPNLDAAEAEQLTVTYTYNGETLVADYWKMMDIYKNGTLYPVFYTVGIAMKDIGEAVVAQVGNGAPMNISVADYLYTKLTKEGYAFATEGEDAGRKNLYLTLLNYGAQAQEVLWNNKHPDQLRTLVTDVIPVYAANGVTIDGQSGLVKLSLAEAGRVDLAYNGAGVVEGYNVTDANGTKFYTGTSAYVSGISRIEPVVSYADATLYDFEGEYTEDTSSVLNQLFFVDGVKVTSNGSTADSHEIAEVRYEEGRGKYLYIYSDQRVTGTDRSHTMILPAAQAVSENPNVTILQFDYKNDSTNWHDDEFAFAGTILYLGSAFGGGTGDRVQIGRGEWNTIRLEAYYDYDLVQVYINGVYAGKVANNYNGDPLSFDEFDSASFNQYNGAGTVNSSYDNITFVKAYKEYVAVPTANPVVETFDAGWTQDTWTVLTNGDPNLEVKASDGKFTSMMDSTGRHNTTGLNRSEVLVDENGNSYFHTYSPGRGGDSANRSHIVTAYFDSIVPTSMINASVIEFDYRFDSDMGSDSVRFGIRTGNNYCYFHTSANNNGVNFNSAGVSVGAKGEWVRLKFVVDYAAMDIKLYADGEYVTTLGAEHVGDKSSSTWTTIWNGIGGAAEYFQFSTYNGGGVVDFSVDNLSVYHTYIAPAAE